MISICLLPLPFLSTIGRDVISGGLGGLKPPIILMIQKFFYVNYTAFIRSENASTSITTL